MEGNPLNRKEISAKMSSADPMVVNVPIVHASANVVTTSLVYPPSTQRFHPT
jgi:hypothetical protein